MRFLESQTFLYVIFFYFSLSAIQQNRDPIGYTKRTRRYPPLKVAGGNGANANRSIDRHSACPNDLHKSFVDGERNNSGQSESPQSVFEVTPEQISEDRLMESLMKVESQISIIRYFSLVIFLNIFCQNCA